MLRRYLRLIGLGWIPSSRSRAVLQRCGTAVLRKHLRLVRLGWIPIRLQLGDAVRRKLNLESSITAKRRNSRMRAEFVVRLQMSLRLGVRAVTPLIATLLSNFFCSEHPIHCARPT